MIMNPTIYWTTILNGWMPTLLPLAQPGSPPLQHLIMPAELARLMALPVQQVRLITVSVTFRSLYYSYLYFLLRIVTE